MGEDRKKYLRYKYLNDTRFHNIVDRIADFMFHHGISVDEMKDVLILADEKLEEQRRYESLNLNRIDSIDINANNSDKGE